MTFPTTKLLDDFNRANQNPIVNGWFNNVSGLVAPLQLGTNQVAGTSAQTSLSLLARPTLSDCEAWATITVLPAAGDHVGITVRHRPVAGTTVMGDSGYQLLYFPTGTAFQLNRLGGGGTLTQIGPLATIAMAAGDKMGLQAVGPVLTAWFCRAGGGWRPIITAIDSAWVYGWVGIRIRNTGARVDNFGGGQYVPRAWRDRLLRVAAVSTPIAIAAPPASVTFSAPAPQLGGRNRIVAPAATVTFSAPAPQVQRIRIVAPAASITFSAPAPTVKEKIRPAAATVTFSAARPAAFLDGTKIQVTPAALLTFSAPAPTISTSSPGIGALPAVSFTPGTSWAFVICDRFGKPISLISRLARNKQLVFNLNRPTQLSFTVPGDDPRVNRIHDGDNLPVLEPGARTVKAYRKEGNQWVLRFAGFLWDRNPAERDASSSVIDIAVTCYDPMQRLVARLCRGSAGGFASTVTFTSTSGSTIAKALVDRTIQYADAFVNDLGIATTGTFQVTTPQTVSYDQQLVAPALIQLCDTQTMDVIFQPVDRQNGILAVMGVVAQRGHDRPSVIFGYDAFPHSVIGWNSSKSMDDFADDLTLYSGQSSTGKKELSAHRTDATAKNTYGTYEDAQVLTDITNQVFLDAIADTEILLRKRPRELVGFTPIPEKSAAPFLDWFLGDTVYTEASANTGAAISGLQRIYGFTLDITDGGFEIVSELRVSADAE